MVLFLSMNQTNVFLNIDCTKSFCIFYGWPRPCRSTLRRVQQETGGHEAAGCSLVPVIYRAGRKPRVPLQRGDTPAYARVKAEREINVLSTPTLSEWPNRTQDLASWRPEKNPRLDMARERLTWIYWQLYYICFIVSKNIEIIILAFFF